MGPLKSTRMINCEVSMFIHFFPARWASFSRVIRSSVVDYLHRYGIRLWFHRSSYQGLLEIQRYGRWGKRWLDLVPKVLGYVSDNTSIPVYQLGI